MSSIIMSGGSVVIRELRTPGLLAYRARVERKDTMFRRMHRWRYIIERESSGWHLIVESGWYGDIERAVRKATECLDAVVAVRWGNQLVHQLDLKVELFIAKMSGELTSESA